MYWRINCTEHLSLDLTVDPKQPRSQPRPSLDQQQQQTSPRSRFARPRSATYSTGTGASLDTHHGLETRYSPLDVSQTVQRFVASADRKFVCGITQQGIYLWSLKPFALLSSLEYDPIEEFGTLVDIAWKPDSRTLFAVLSHGYVYEISVYEREEPALEYRFAVQHYFVRGPGEAQGIPSVGLAQRRT
ncbi:WD40 repeat protein, partial [Linderina pennispora]